MATIKPRHNLDGSITWRVWIRRKGQPQITRAFSSEKEAQDYVKKYEMHYAFTGEIPEYDVLYERRLREMRKSNGLV